MTVPYLDCNASTPVDDVVRQRMGDVLQMTGNASASHASGRAMAALVDDAIDQVAALTAFSSHEVVVTSGATEANAIALRGLPDVQHVLVSPLEHASVRQEMAALQRSGVEVEELRVDVHGRVRLDDLQQKLRPTTSLVSVMGASNLTSVVQPIEDIADVLDGHDALFHVDGAQLVGKRVDAVPARVDLLTLSAHKFFGPQGVGALCIRDRVADVVQPLVVGGGQQDGRRGGTLPVALVVGMGEASRQCLLQHVERAERCRAFGVDVLRALDDVGARVLGEARHRLPHGLCAVFPGVEAEAAQMLLGSVCEVSLGSACDAGQVTESPALTAMGIGLAQQASVLRMSWCHLTDDVDWTRFVDVIRQLQPR